MLHFYFVFSSIQIAHRNNNKLRTVWGWSHPNIKNSKLRQNLLVLIKQSVFYNSTKCLRSFRAGLGYGKPNRTKVYRYCNHDTSFRITTRVTSIFMPVTKITMQELSSLCENCLACHTGLHTMKCMKQNKGTFCYTKSFRMCDLGVTKHVIVVKYHVSWATM